MELFAKPKRKATIQITYEYFYDPEEICFKLEENPLDDVEVENLTLLRLECERGEKGVREFLQAFNAKPTGAIGIS